MNFLFVLDNLKKNCDANINIALIVAKRLRQSGHKVYAVVREKEDSKADPFSVKCFDGVSVVEDVSCNQLIDYQKRIEWRDLNGFRKVLYYICNIRATFAWIDINVFMNRRLKKSLLRKIREMDEKYNIDAGVAFFSPHLMEEVLSFCDLAIKVLVLLDPYVFDQTLDKNKISKRMREEIKIYRRLDLVFVTSKIYEEYEKHLLNINKSLFRIYQFPGIIESETQSKKIRDNDKMTIDCFFIGSFDIVVRNPVFVLELFRKLPKEFVLHIVGRGMEDILEKYKCELGERLILHGMVSRWDAHAYMKNADVLVNVNNAVTNQLPSKLFEYINTGNPILNICKIKNCPSLEYMERYPLAYTLFEEDGINDSVVGKVKSFIRESYDKTVPKQEVLENYYDCTDGYVANLICENIEKTHK